MYRISETRLVPAGSYVVPINVIAGIPRLVDPRYPNTDQRLQIGYFFQVHESRTALIQLAEENLVWNEEDRVPKFDYLVVERVVHGQR